MLLLGSLTSSRGCYSTHFAGGSRACACLADPTPELIGWGGVGGITWAWAVAEVRVGPVGWDMLKRTALGIAVMVLAVATPGDVDCCLRPIYGGRDGTGRDGPWDQPACGACSAGLAIAKEQGAHE